MSAKCRTNAAALSVFSIDLLCSLVAMPDGRPAGPGEKPTALLRVCHRNGVLLVGCERVVCAQGIRLQPMRRHRHSVFKRGQTRTGCDVGKVIMPARRMVDGISAATRHFALKRDQLTPQSIVVE